MTPLATYFSKSRLMARFQSHLCISFHKKGDIIGDLEVPDDALDFPFFVEVNTLVRLILYASFFNLAPGLVAEPGIRKVYSCA